MSKKLLSRKVSLKKGVALLIAPVSLLLALSAQVYAVSTNNLRSTAMINNVADVQLTGTVVDQKGETMPGVTIRVKGSSKVTSTDVNGVFKISLSNGENVLVVTFIGYKTQEVLVSGKTSVKIILEPGTSSLDEVVVIGYGTIKKRDLTGAVSSVSGTDISMNPVSNPLEALQGRVAGLDVQRSSGQAGAAPVMLIRGNRSVYKNDPTKPNQSGTPLYIVDGIQGDPTSINPDDIDRIDVLKDASSTAIYGSQGANGVIIITTKKAKAGQATIDVDSYYGINGFASYPKPLQGDKWIQYLQDRYFAANGKYSTDIISDVNLPGYARAPVQNGDYVDWVHETLKRGAQQNHHIAIRGGSEKVQGYFSLGLIDEKGIYKGDEVKSYNARAGADVEFNKFIKAGIQNTFNLRDGSTSSSVVNKAYGMLPIGTPYNADGSVNRYPIGDGVTPSPIANYEPGVYRNESKFFYMAINPYLEIHPISNLSIRSNLTLNLGYTRKGTFENENSYQSLSQALNYKQASYSTQLNYGYIWENIINYNLTLLKDHTITLTGITSLSDSKTEKSAIAGQGLDYDDFAFYNMGAISLVTNKSSEFSGQDRLSFAGRLNYSYKGKYLLTVTERFDGASQLVKQWAQFPSFALGWRISEEGFMRNTKNWLSNMKLRGSYGIVGNSNIDPYSSQLKVVSNSASTPLTLGGSATLPIYVLSQTVNSPDLTWERSYNTNVGLDMSFFNDRFEFVAEAYYTDTRGLLYDLPLPSSSGGFDAKNVYKKTANVGSSTTRGFELTASGQPIRTKDFKWNSTLTYTRAEERLTSLDLGNSVTASQLISLNLFIGSPLYTLYGYKKIGIWQTDEKDEAAKYGAKPGDMKIRTVPIINSSGVSDEGVHTYNVNNDKQVVGHQNPDWSLGWQNTFTYKNFDLNVFINMRYGQTINAQILGYYNSTAQPETYNYWTPSNPSTDFPQPSTGSTINSTSATGFGAGLSLVDGSYIKIKNLTLGYTLPKKIGSKVGLSRLRVYGTTYNPFIFTKSNMLKGVDPESGGTDSFPLYKQIVFGLNLTF
ncbi:TonB-dependent receptor [Mucilaginibacter sp. HMF5004]|uniref:SusC/RagA family TonB-linked outer membrane protein n=1 Tax=Mucilaginibacter rivuli TaxID=2857527 RepID=UPI001C5DC804|nr:TonB-dependent receptor [Mucilaginibacter rivuli]MBW4891875.1 TonB-dependent receptor [Mucilaginibacter rivuli]